MLRPCVTVDGFDREWRRLDAVYERKNKCSLNFIMSVSRATGTDMAWKCGRSELRPFSSGSKKSLKGDAGCLLWGWKPFCRSKIQICKTFKLKAFKCLRNFCMWFCPLTRNTEMKINENWMPQLKAWDTDLKCRCWKKYELVLKFTGAVGHWISKYLQLC